ncbi:AAA family ATPase [Marinomonas sp. TI.3.20]|uniref:AAA family ATPase n=1 Tax=Marinomonas sp. TI.3.20 TaxID=3121296 RepID=UPI00311FA3D3
MNFEIKLKNIQHIKSLELKFDLSENKIMCLSGKNSVGKTTLFRSVRNLYLNNTFIETAAPYIFQDDSYIEYRVEDYVIKFSYNKRLGSIDTKQDISDELKGLFLVELSIPHGERFDQFQRLSNLDEELRSKIALGEYSEAADLIEFLNEIYCDNRFDGLKNVKIKGKDCCFILKDDVSRYYIREDYFSSGEYFLINLYRNIKRGKKVIFIDEIDISLDASAQVNLIRSLRVYCKHYGVNIFFTTHSLALMKTLESDELFYIESYQDGSGFSIENRSYNFIKSVMYGFNGFDKYILTEDERLAHYLEYLISDFGSVFYKYKIIYIGGASQVVDLARRNLNSSFLAKGSDVIIVLDGDQVDEEYHADFDNINFLPFSNIEVQVLEWYESLDERLPKVDSIDGKKRAKRAKNLFWKLTKNDNGRQLISPEKIYNYLDDSFLDGVGELKRKIREFLFT